MKKGKKKSRPHSRRPKYPKQPDLWCASCRGRIRDTWIQYTDGSCRHLACAAVYSGTVQRVGATS